jgi:hypothetical protein
MDFLAQISSDFATIAGGEFSSPFSITDGTLVANLRGLFYHPSQYIDPDTQSVVADGYYRLQIAESATDYQLRRKGLIVALDGASYRVREWTFDGMGGLTLILDLCKGDATPSTGSVFVSGRKTENLTLADLVEDSTDTFRLKKGVPKAETLAIFIRGWRLALDQFQDNGDGTFTILDHEILPLTGDVIVADYAIYTTA